MPASSWMRISPVRRRGETQQADPGSRALCLADLGAYVRSLGLAPGLIPCRTF